jgi:hypothetical protein
MVVLALVGVPIAMLNQINQFAALLLLSGADYLKVFPADQIHAQVMFFLNLHKHGGLIISVIVDAIVRCFLILILLRCV